MRRVLCMMLILLFIPLTSYASEKMDLDIYNNLGGGLIEFVTTDVKCMKRVPHNTALSAGYHYPLTLEEDDTGTCAFQVPFVANKKFKTTIYGFNKTMKVGELKYARKPFDTVCGAFTVSTYQKKYYDITLKKSNCGLGQTPQLDMVVKYANGYNPQVQFTLINNYKPAQILSLQWLIPDSSYYSAAIPEEIQPGAHVTLGYYPAKSHVFSNSIFYGLDTDTYCKFTYTFGIYSCYAFTEATNNNPEKKISCFVSVKSSKTNSVGLCGDYHFTISSGTILPRDVNINLNNQNNSNPIFLKSYNPPYDLVMKNYNPMPPDKLDQNTTQTFQYIQEDESDANVTYELESEKAYCRLNYNFKDVKDCKPVIGETINNDLIWNLKCEVSNIKINENPPSCTFDVNYSTTLKLRATEIGIENQTGIDLTRSNLVTPTGSSYDPPPQPTIVTNTEDSFTFKQTSNIAGSVRYSANENQYCDITYNWQYEKDTVKGCQITATAVNTGDPEQVIICACNQAAGSNVCQTQQIIGQNCQASIQFYVGLIPLIKPLIPLTPPLIPLRFPLIPLIKLTGFTTTLQNIYYYDLKRGDYTPTDPAPPGTIAMSTQRSWSGYLRNSTAQTVQYLLKNDPQNRSCTFTYSFDKDKGICSATSTKQGSISCNVCKSTMNVDEKKCEFIFSVGGECVMP